MQSPLICLSVIRAQSGGYGKLQVPIAMGSNQQWQSKEKNPSAFAAALHAILKLLMLQLILLRALTQRQKKEGGREVQK